MWGFLLTTAQLFIPWWSMKKKTRKPTFNVVVTAHDSWSGPEILYIKPYATKRGALNFCKKINGENTLSFVPDYYTTARLQD